MATPRATRLSIPDDDVADLRRRIAQTRWPDQLQGADWNYGAELTCVKELAAYWATEFDWRKQEAYLNTFDNYLLEVDDIDLHFIHAKSSSHAAIPLLLVHGWPGSFFEFHKCISALTNPGKDGGPAFNVVVPSLPGYGLSTAPRQPGFGVKAMARTLNKLMVKLGYEKYVAQGGDWGGLICKTLGSLHHDNCQAIHVNFAVCQPSYYSPLHVAQILNAKLPILNWLPITVSREEISYIQSANAFRHGEAGYMEIQSTKPQTLAYALNDSPVGLMAWIVEKFRTWSDCGGNVEACFTKDELLTNVALYWFTQRISSSVRLYYEARKARDALLPTFCKAPTGVAIFPKELFKAPRSWVRKDFNLKHYKAFSSGGHFAALEKPDELVKDMRNFFSKWH